ncbi:helix-turn-helix domain-containing protein [Streptomyces pinistramenti]|uniref:helix-turn-helix domain-containing protein n=1 Tax=Streptomyces pinistramenti TaxID=2884812 RepID=UPI001D07564C|nr:helix-turn-helix domain-containing protein [Streptomyces pinistramenti]MCB5907801.1 helix-turn-helix domain-containing protein [Streptomyces pinistramenti]
MHVDDLLQLDDLDLTLLWGDEPLLAREVSGVTATGLEPPETLPRDGELVVSGLGWWTPGEGGAKADRFVAALRSAGAAALLTGEETHGAVPQDLVAACRTHRVPLFSVPAHTTFRAVTEAVRRHRRNAPGLPPTDPHALPENVRTELDLLLARGAGPDELLDRAFAHLDGPACMLLTATGRTLARTPSAPRLPAPRAARELRGATGTSLRIEADSGPYDSWFLRLPDADETPSRALHEVADVLARHRQAVDRRAAAGRRAADEWVALAAAPSVDSAAVASAVHACGLPSDGPYRVVVAAFGADDAVHGGESEPVAGALAEALAHAPGTPSAVGRLPGGEAVALVATGAGDTVRATLGDLWPVLRACAPDRVLRAGVSGPVRTAELTGTALEQARYALAAARQDAPRGSRVTAVEDLTSLASLLAGVPRSVRTAFSRTVLGPLAEGAGASHRMLLETLEVFLARHGSWARTAEALHLHVNTVHYRIQRIEMLTGRDLSRLDHKLDLRAALLCR